MADPFVTFPGTAGNYASRADTNLLDADTAHLQQSIGFWRRNGALMGIPFQSQDLTPLFGSSHGAFTIPSGNGADNLVSYDQADVSGSAVPVVAGQTYTFILALATDSPANCKFSNYRVRWLDAAGGQIGQTTLESELALTAGWVVQVHSVVAPALSEFVGWFAQNDGVGAAGTELVYFDAAMVADGTVAEFVPSLRIVGDLDLRADMDPVTWSPVADEYLVDFRGTDTNTGFQMFYRPGDTFFVGYGDGTVSRNANSSDHGPLTGRNELRATFDVSGGVWQFYVAGVSIGTSGGLSTNPGVGTDREGRLAVNQFNGQNYDGNVYTAEVRDGIDGPIVAQFRAQDLIGAVPL